MTFRLPLRAPYSQTVPFSRKKPKLESSENDDYDFEMEATRILEDIEVAMRPLQGMNEKFDIIKLPEELRIDTGVKGWFNFSINRKLQHLIVSTPVSGTFSYQFDPESRHWLNVRDGHDMRGLVTRDVLRAYTGCPIFS